MPGEQGDEDDVAGEGAMVEGFGTHFLNLGVGQIGLLRFGMGFSSHLCPLMGLAVSAHDPSGLVWVVSPFPLWSAKVLGEQGNEGDGAGEEAKVEWFGTCSLLLGVG